MRWPLSSGKPPQPAEPSPSPLPALRTPCHGLREALSAWSRWTLTAKPKTRPDSKLQESVPSGDSAHLWAPSLPTTGAPSAAPHRAAPALEGAAWKVVGKASVSQAVVTGQSVPTLPAHAGEDTNLLLAPGNWT